MVVFLLDTSVLHLLDAVVRGHCIVVALYECTVLLTTCMCFILAGVATKFCDNGTHSCPAPRVPWFGYLLFQRTVNPAATGEDTIGDGNPGSYAVITKAEATRPCGASVKVWPVLHISKDRRHEELRVAVLNKQTSQHCHVVIKVTGAFNEPGEITRLLPGEKLLYAKGEVTFGGQRYLTLDGKLGGQRVPPEKVIGRRILVEPKRRPGDRDTVEGTEFVILVPKASALLMVARKAADVTVRKDVWRSTLPMPAPSRSAAAAVKVAGVTAGAKQAAAAATVKVAGSAAGTRAKQAAAASRSAAAAMRVAGIKQAPAAAVKAAGAAAAAKQAAAAATAAGAGAVIRAKQAAAALKAAGLAAAKRTAAAAAAVAAHLKTAVSLKGAMASKKPLVHSVTALKVAKQTIKPPPLSHAAPALPHISSDHKPQVVTGKLSKAAKPAKAAIKPQAKQRTIPAAMKVTKQITAGKPSQASKKRAVKPSK